MYFLQKKSLISYGGSNSSQDGALWGVFFSWGSRHRCTMEVGAYDPMRCGHYHSRVVDADVSQTCLISVRLRDVLPCTCKNGWTNRHTASSVWNSLPVSVQNCDTLTLFKSRLKAHLFPPSMLLNCPVRQRLWSHGNMALYKFCVVLLYCLWTHVGTRNHVLDWGIKIGATWQIRQIDLFGSRNAALCQITLSFIKILTPLSVE